MGFVVFFPTYEPTEAKKLTSETNKTNSKPQRKYQDGRRNATESARCVEDRET